MPNDDENNGGSNNTSDNDAPPFTLVYIGLETCNSCLEFSSKLWPRLELEVRTLDNLRTHSWVVPSKAHPDWKRVRSQFKFDTVPALFCVTPDGEAHVWPDQESRSLRSILDWTANVWAGNNIAWRINGDNNNTNSSKEGSGGRWIVLAMLTVDDDPNLLMNRPAAESSMSGDESAGDVVRQLCQDFQHNLIQCVRVWMPRNTIPAPTLCFFDSRQQSNPRRHQPCQYRQVRRCSRRRYHAITTFGECQEWMYRQAFVPVIGHNGGENSSD